MEAEIDFELLGAERVDELRPLYEALAAHHGEIRPTLAGLTAKDPADGWVRRRASYREWLAQPGSFALLARRDGRPLGFALVTIEEGFDSWGTGGRIGELHDLAVLPGERGAGLGRLLLDRVATELAGVGIEHVRLDVLAGNDDAFRFYERWGLEPVVTTMLGPTRRPEDA
jgi:GNAT superfamily N-acetyltransferase